MFHFVVTLQRENDKCKFAHQNNNKMSPKIPFTKMHGAGNDYIYVNTLVCAVPSPEKASIAWSDRHKGIGSDGLVLIGAPSDATKADYSMRIFNADGSEAMMCGNASRCIGKYLYERHLTNQTQIRLETLSGVKILNLHLDEPDVKTDDDGAQHHVTSVTVDMLEPQLEKPEQYVGHVPTFQLHGTIGGRFVSMGNPHYVIFVDDISKVDVAAVGSELECSPSFPERCNIEFAQVVAPGKIRTRVWERGSGITMACGTGACATAVAAAKLGLSGRESDILMDGGDLHIAWSEQDNHVYMTGPAAFVCDGEVSLPD